METNKNCNYCYSCNSCNSCNYCNYCNSCKNLKMTEYNIFCYSKNYDDKDSFQQKRYRVFNKEVGEKRWYEIKDIINKIIPSKDIMLGEFYKSITMEQWKKLLEIPEAEGFKEGFEYISGSKINLEEKENLSGKIVSVIIDNKTYSAKIL